MEIPYSVLFFFFIISMWDFAHMYIVSLLLLQPDQFNFLYIIIIIIIGPATNRNPNFSL